MHPLLIKKMAETLVADRLTEAERFRRAAGDENATSQKLGQTTGVGRFAVPLASIEDEAGYVQSCPAGWRPRR